MSHSDLSFIPKEVPKNSFRVALELTSAQRRLDQVLLDALRNQKENLALKNITRTEFKILFSKKKIRIKGQPALPSSGIAAGTTWVDVLL